jgi:hypothetical protein
MIALPRHYRCNCRLRSFRRNPHQNHQNRRRNCRSRTRRCGTIFFIKNSKYIQRPTPTVTSTNAPTKASGTATSKPVIPKSVPTSDNQSVKYKDEQETRDSIRDVRSDSTSTNW